MTKAQICLRDSFQKNLFTERLEKCERYIERFNKVEMEFITGLREMHGLVGDTMRITTKQMNWLGQLADKK